MALIKNAEAGTLTRDAVVLDLGDLAREGERVRAQAEAEARAILERAGKDADRIIEEAMERGFEEGRKAGAEQGRAAGYEAGRNEAYEEQFSELRSVVAGWGGALDIFEAARDRLLREARRDVVELAVRVAERVVKARVEADGGCAARQLEAALALTLDATALRVEVNGADHESVSEALPGLLARLSASPNVEVTTSDDVERGGCRVRADAGVIDATIGEQLRRVTEELLPDGPSERWAGEAETAARGGVSDGPGEPGKSAEPDEPEGEAGS